MRLLAWMFMTMIVLYFSIGACRVLSMTFDTFSRSITIKNDKLARLLIAYENTWHIATSAEKRNKMSLVGLVSYILFSPQIPFLVYDLWIFFTTGVVEWCSAEETYIIVMTFYYIIAVLLKIHEANKFEKGDIW